VIQTELVQKCRNLKNCAYGVVENNRARGKISRPRLKMAGNGGQLASVPG